MISTALKPTAELYAATPRLLPEHPVLTHFSRLIFSTAFPIYSWNSVIVAGATTALVITIASLGAYSLERFPFPGRQLIGQLILFTYLLPSVVLLLPLYLIMAGLGLTNSLLSLVIAHTTFALPFALWLLRSFVAAIPIELEEAARTDGAGRLGAFVDIVLPQARPGIISTALFAFILSWNEYLYAAVLISRDTSKTLPPGVITMLTSAFSIEWPLLMAASVIMSVPLVVAFAFLQRFLIRGLGGGGVKG
jgi:ABC-type glycerol-3-phosphate transport system permease component